MPEKEKHGMSALLDAGTFLINHLGFATDPALFWQARVSASAVDGCRSESNG